MQTTQVRITFRQASRDAVCAVCAAVFSNDNEKELTARSTSLTHFSIRKASLYAGNTIEISFPGSATFKAFIRSLSKTNTA
jgi:hypothetical protein